MSGRNEKADLHNLLDVPEARRWMEMNEREVAAFQHHLRSLDPASWQDEFVRIVLQSVEHVDDER